MKSFVDNPFQNINPADILFEDHSFYLVWDRYPVSPGHILIISKSSSVDFFTLSETEQTALNPMIVRAKDIIQRKFNPDGFNIGMNCGEPAGQTVMRFHCHVIPRYNGDTPNPRGGVRNCIPGKGDYTAEIVS
jgi:diadenosine tetraphosphate (Ap4A) HIT family hydrolase